MQHLVTYEKLINTLKNTPKGTAISDVVLYIPPLSTDSGNGYRVCLPVEGFSEELTDKWSTESSSAFFCLHKAHPKYQVTGYYKCKIVPVEFISGRFDGNRISYLDVSVHPLEEVELS